MRVVMFYHSLVSDWNHGNAHFLRGVVTELMTRGHEVKVFEPHDGWSLSNLRAEQGEAPLQQFYQYFPHLRSEPYDPLTLDLDEALSGAELVLVHEWNSHELVARLGAHRARSRGYRLLFHDTHHRAVTAPESIAAYDLSAYDGVLAFGESLRERYARMGWGNRAFTWHEAADIRCFSPIPGLSRQGDLVWIGNWGDEERTREIEEFLLEPVRALRFCARVYGVRYPPAARAALARAGVVYEGWLPNYRVPEVFGRFLVTVHIPRRPYVEALPGIPTIRVFEALACGIPLVSAPWRDTEGLFSPGQDFLLVQNGEEMKRALRRLLLDKELAEALAAHGRRTVLARHTCGHRVDELFAICRGLGLDVKDSRPQEPAFAEG